MNLLLKSYKILQELLEVVARGLGGGSALRGVGALPGSPRAILCSRSWKDLMGER